MDREPRAIRNCAWGYKCDQTWDTLIASDNPVVRHCDHCDHDVYLCDNLDDLAITVARGHCAAFPERLIRRFGGDDLVVGNLQDPPDDVLPSAP